MGLNSPILLKGLAGLGAASAVSVGCVFLYDPEIFGFSELTIEERFNNELIKYIEGNNDIQFDIKTGETVLSNSFPDISTGNLVFLTVTPKASEKTKLDEIKKKLKIEEDISWSCRLIFNRKRGNNISLEDNLKNKLFKNSSTDGFLNKLAQDTSSAVSGKEKIKELKRKFIRNCSNTANKGFSYENTFELVPGTAGDANGKTETGKLYFESDEEFKKWFEDTLTAKDKTSIEDGYEWNILEKRNNLKLTISKKGQSNEKMNGCLIDIGRDLKTKEIKAKIDEKIGSKNPLNKKYKSGLLKKCRSSGDILDLSISNISGLFDFSEEILVTTEESNLVGGTWKITESNNNNDNKVVEISVTAKTGSDSRTCKIVGTASETIDPSNLNNSKTEIKTSLERKLGDSANNKDSNRKKFLEKCQKSFNEEINWELSKKTGDKYELKDLEQFFTTG